MPIIHWIILWIMGVDGSVRDPPSIAPPPSSTHTVRSAERALVAGDPWSAEEGRSRQVIIQG